MTFVFSAPVVVNNYTVPDLEISGRLTQGGEPPGIRLVRLVSLPYMEVMAATMCNAAGYFVFKHGPQVVEPSMVIATVDTLHGAAVQYPVSTPDALVNIDTIPSSSGITLTPILGGRRLYLSEGKIRGLPPA